MMAISSKVTTVSMAAAIVAMTVTVSACGGGTSETARAPQAPQVRTTSVTMVGTTHTTAAPAPTSARLPRLTPSERAARRAEERAQLVVLKARCEEESGGPYSRSERAKKRAEAADEAALLDHACDSAALAIASILEADEAAAADAKAAERAGFTPSSLPQDKGTR